MKSKIFYFHFVLVLILLSFLSSTVHSIDHYYYWNQRIDLIPRDDRIIVIFKEGELTETAQQNELVYAISGLPGEINRVHPNTWLIKTTDKIQYSNLNATLQLISSRSNNIKTVSKVYFGEDSKVIQCPLDEIIVRLRNESDKMLLDYLNEQNGAFIVGEVSNSRSFLLKTKNENNLNGLELAELYRNTSLFEFVEPNFGYAEWSILDHIPNDPFFPSQWALLNTGQAVSTAGVSTWGDALTTTGLPGADMKVSDAWDFTTGSPTITVAIFDTGIDSAHVDLQPNVLLGYDAVHNVYGVPVDSNGHGTFCAGLIGAVMDNSIGVAGIAPGCKVMSIRILNAAGFTTSGSVVRGLDTALKHDIDVQSHSWSGTSPSASIESSIDSNAINGRSGLGTVIFGSSGNNGRNPPNYPASYKNVLAVGASTFHDNKKSPGSGSQYWWGGNYGSRSSVMYLAFVAPTMCYTTGVGSTYVSVFNGTSASCPNAAGIAALMLSVNSTLTRTDVSELMAQGCDKVDNLEYNEDRTYGKWNNYYGYGRVNAFNSVRLAAGVDVAPPSISHKNINSHSSTYPTEVKAIITDHDGSAVPTSGSNEPKLFFRKKVTGGAWGDFDSIPASSNDGNEFRFHIPGAGYGTEFNYYIRARDAAGNGTTFPVHAEGMVSYNLCYYAVGEFLEFTDKVSGWTFDGTPSISPVMTVPTSFPVLDVSVRLYVENTWMNDITLLCLWAPGTDTANYRKAMWGVNYPTSTFTPLGGIVGSTVNDTFAKFWKDDFAVSGLWFGGEYKPDHPFRSLIGTEAMGSWKFLGRDIASGDVTFADSLRIFLKGLESTLSPCARLDNEADSLVFFPSVVEVDTIDFYLKNTGNATLTISTFDISGDYPEKFSVINSPVLSIPAGDSSLFKIECDPLAMDKSSASLTDNIENAILTINTNDPFKSEFEVSLQNDEALPVDLIEFNATIDKNNVTLNWTTAWEENNMRFDLQRRNFENNESEGKIKMWETVGSVAGNGTTYEPKSYSYIDKNLVSGIYEYRLIQVDFDGNSTADHTLSSQVEIGIPNEFALSQNYPNPFNPTTKIDFQIPIEVMTRLVVYDISGREVAILVNEIMTPGYYTYTLNGSFLSSGVYFYRLVSGNSVITKRAVLVK